MKRYFVRIVLIVMMFFLVTPMAKAQQKGLDWDNPIKVGYLNPFTGPATLTTSLDLPGVRLAIEEVNAAGGVLGRPLTVIPRDDKLNPEHALREAKDLVANEKVFWVHGITSSGVARAVSQYARTRKRSMQSLLPNLRSLQANGGIDMFLGVQITLKWKT